MNQVAPIGIRTDIGVVIMVFAIAVLLLILFLVVKLIAKPSFGKFALLGFFAMVLLVGTFGLLGTVSYRASAEYPVTHEMAYPPYVVDLPMDEIRNAQQEMRNERQARRAEQMAKLEEMKAELAEALAEVNAEKEEARLQVREAQLQAREATKQAEEIARTATQSARQEVWQDFAKGFTKGEWKESLKDLGDYLDAIEGVDLELSLGDDEAETATVSYDGVGEEIPGWMNDFQGPGQIIPEGDTFRTMLFLGPDEDKEEALRASLAECQRWFCSANEFESNLAAKFPVKVSRRKLRDCIKRTHQTESRTTGLPVEYLLVEFDKRITRDMRRHAEDVRAAENSVNAGIYGATTLGFVGMLFGFLKFGEWRTSRKPST